MSFLIIESFLILQMPGLQKSGLEKSGYYITCCKKKVM